jgi:hypothetical protein
METPKILTDPRPIAAVFTPEGGTYRVGCGVTEIVAYGEPGMHCDVPWLLVRLKDGRDLRLNGATIEGIEYATPTESED